MKRCARGSWLNGNWVKGVLAGLALAPAAALAIDVEPQPDYTVDVRASTYAQVFQRNLAPGVNGTVLETEQMAPFYGYAFLRVEGVDLPWGKDALNAELSVWGSLGLLTQPLGKNADGDIISAWVQDKQGPFRLRLGRQVTMPGAARYVRFDGVTAEVRLGAGLDLSASAGFVALPRWNKARGYYVLGSMADALKDPNVLADQNRANSWLVSARVGWVGTPWLKASLSFHEQHEVANQTYTLDADGKPVTTSALAFRNVAADAILTKFDKLVLGGRLVFDLANLAVAEARLYGDLGFFDKLPLSIDYSYQAPGLLLPASSILAAFGGGSWHELGAEASWRPTDTFRFIVRAAGQAYVDRPGLRASARAVWVPDAVDQRTQVIGEVVRVGAGTSGYTNLRAAVRYRVAEFLTASADGAVYFYDQPVRGTQLSAMAFGSFEYAFMPRLRFMLSGSLASTPFAALDAQLLGRVVFELETPSAGGGM
jgi:hypothetical protein